MWKLFQLIVFFWILFTLMSNEAMNDNRAAQAFVAGLGAFFATEWLVWLIWLPSRLRYRWNNWRRERATRHQPSH
jgi:hypothetical protein